MLRSKWRGGTPISGQVDEGTQRGKNKDEKEDPVQTRQVNKVDYVYRNEKPQRTAGKRPDARWLGQGLEDDRKKDEEPILRVITLNPLVQQSRRRYSDSR